MGGEAGAGRGGSQARSGAGGRIVGEAGDAAGGDLGQAGMAATEGGAPTGMGGSPTEPGGDAGAGGTVEEQPGGAGGLPGNPGGAGSDPGSSGGGAGGVGGASGDAGSDAGGAGADAGGAGGAGGIEPTVVFDFEDGVQGFTTDGANVTIATSTAQTVSGAQSLRVTLPSMADDNRLVFLDGAAFWPGTVIELNVWVPEGDDDLYVQAFSLIDFYQWDATDSLATPLVRGGWTTWTYTVPGTFPGGMQRLGIQFGAGPRTFAGGDVYVDAIATLDGPAACSGEAVTRPTDTPGRREFDFESDSPEWEVDGSPPDVALSRSGGQVLSGTSALRVALTAIPAGENRKVRIPGPETFCGDTVTFNVWTPAGSDGLTLQAFVQYNNWAGWAGAMPDVVDRGAYTEITLSVPGLDSAPSIGPGGYQALGLEIANETGAPFTGDVYIDDVSWQ
jgi:hypothetical protein